MNRTVVIGTFATAVIGVASWFFLNPVSADDGHREGRGSHHWKGHHGGGHQFGRRRGRRLDRLLRHYDGNDDGKLTQEELDDGRKSLMARHDKDGGRGLTIEEFESLWLELRRRRMVRSFQRLDVDGDGTVTTEEFVEPFSKVVKWRDLNDDGALSEEDRLMPHMKRRHKMRKRYRRMRRIREELRGRRDREDMRDRDEDESEKDEPSSDGNNRDDS